MIVDEVTTLTGPGELRRRRRHRAGIAINPRRGDLLDAVKVGLTHPGHSDHSGKWSRSAAASHAATAGRRVVAAVKWWTTVLDSV